MQSIDEEFIQACANGNLDQAKKLHNCGADIYDFNAQYAACKNGHIKIMKWLYSLDNNLILNDVNLVIIEEVICTHNHIKLAKWLYNLGINIDGVSLFLCACSHGSLEIAKWLHRQGVNINAYDNGAFVSACINGHLEIVKLLYSHGVTLKSNLNNVEVFLWTYINAHYHVIKWLCESDQSLVAKYMMKLDDTTITNRLGLSEITSNLLLKIKYNQPLPIVDEIDDEIDDVVIYALFKFNRIDDLQ